MRRRCTSLTTITWSVHSCRAEPIKRSTRPFCQGERKDVGRSRIPIARTRALNAAEGLPSLQWPIPPRHHVDGNRGLGDGDAEFEQFAVDLGSAPQRVLKTHSSDQVA